MVLEARIGGGESFLRILPGSLVNLKEKCYFGARGVGLSARVRGWLPRCTALKEWPGGLHCAAGVLRCEAGVLLWVV